MPHHSHKNGDSHRQARSMTCTQSCRQPAPSSLQHWAGTEEELRCPYFVPCCAIWRLAVQQIFSKEAPVLHLLNQTSEASKPHKRQILWITRLATTLPVCASAPEEWCPLLTKHRCFIRKRILPNMGCSLCDYGPSPAPKECAATLFGEQDSDGQAVGLGKPWESLGRPSHHASLGNHSTCWCSCSIV